ncbi:MAG: RNA polymerase sigma factor [Spirochaetia bacterium]|nr:RNA polymerase sigma factor [Spirochaetia bacterium]
MDSDKRLKERELIEKVKAGDSQAYYDLVSDYRERLFRKACSIVGDVDEAEDLLQEALVSAYLAIHSFRGESGIYTWLYRIVVNRCRDFLRSSGNRAIPMDPLDPFSLVVKDFRPGIEKNHEHSEEASYLMDKINSLNGKYKKILLLRYYDELSYQEIGELMKMNIGTVKSRLFKARELLKRMIIADKGESYFE